jgi:hypothetical protein
MLKDKEGNTLFKKENCLFILLANEKFPRKIGILDEKEKTLIVNRKENIHLFHKNNSYGFNYQILNTATKFNKVKLIERTKDGTNIYNIPLDVILKEGTFLNFKKEGFELQIFLKKEIIEKWKI